MATTLIKKLRLDAEKKALVLNSPKGFLERLEGFSLDTKTADKYDFVQLFIKNSGEITSPL